MTARHWWAGVLTLVAALLAHALIPRYEWRPLVGVHWIRVDRWTGQAAWGRFDAVQGRWVRGLDIKDPRAAALDAEIDKYLASLPAR